MQAFTTTLTILGKLQISVLLIDHHGTPHPAWVSIAQYSNLLLLLTPSTTQAKVTHISQPWPPVQGKQRKTHWCHRERGNNLTSSQWCHRQTNNNLTQMLTLHHLSKSKTVCLEQWSPHCGPGAKCSPFACVYLALGALFHPLIPTIGHNSPH